MAGGLRYHPGSPAMEHSGWNGINSNCRRVSRTSGTRLFEGPQPPAINEPASVTSGERPRVRLEITRGSGQLAGTSEEAKMPGTVCQTKVAQSSPCASPRREMSLGASGSPVRVGSTKGIVCPYVDRARTTQNFPPQVWLPSANKLARTQ
eukprot:2370172-Alexandrium_andersonii.AAC.1